MKQSNWSFKLLVFSNFALVVLLMFTFISGYDKVSASKDTSATTSSSTSVTLVNYGKECKEDSYESVAIKLEYTVDHNGVQQRRINNKIYCALRYNLAKWFNENNRREDRNKTYFTLGDGTNSIRKIHDIMNDGVVISPPTKKVDVPWCSQTLSSLNPKASWQFAVHSCMLLYKQIYLLKLTDMLKRKQISEQDYRMKVSPLSRNGSEDADWNPGTYEYKLNTRDPKLFGMQVILPSL